MEEDDYEEEDRMRRELQAREQFLRQNGQESTLEKLEISCRLQISFFIIKFFFHIFAISILGLDPDLDSNYCRKAEKFAFCCLFEWYPQ